MRTITCDICGKVVSSAVSYFYGEDYCMPTAISKKINGTTIHSPNLCNVINDVCNACVKTLNYTIENLVKTK